MSDLLNRGRLTGSSIDGGGIVRGLGMSAAAAVAHGGNRPSASMIDVVRRKNASRESTSTLKLWLYEHRKNPYPSKAEKIMLAILTRMTLTQVSTWFANARRRLKKENKNGEWGLRETYESDGRRLRILLLSFTRCLGTKKPTSWWG